VPPSDVDSDGDGIFNKVDACVTIPGLPSTDPKKHGCPPDRDGDTIYDKDDACPDVLGAPSQDAKRHGCPVDQSTGAMVLLDRDADGVLDGDDKCVDVPGLKEAPAGLTAEQKTDWAKRFIGCPEDIDKDKIVNLQDACPRNPGKPNKDLTKHGCPLALIDACQIRITDRVYFKTSSDKIETIGDKGKTSQAVLQAVIEILKENAHLKKVEVQGHASQDASPRNQELSDKRAAAVVTWLVQHGVDVTRLVPKGYGTTLPAPGVSMEKAYKELHQRVEFYVIEPQCATPAPSK
jgi:outer membrane protein OmpA-like peptidoglycan-associated protein